MTLNLLIYLFLLSIFLTLTLSLAFKNRGPWNNPMLFFTVHFLTSWSLLLWSGPVRINQNEQPFVTGTAVALIIAIVLAATKIRQEELERLRTLKDSKVVDVVTQSRPNRSRIIPSRYFWGLLTLESLIIIAAYILRFNMLL
jgi:hypothetical protein